MPETVRGLLESGNTGDLDNRPKVKNPDGSVSTVRSMSFSEKPGEEILIATANDGLVLSDEDAIARYHATGEHLGKFDSPENATAYADALHRSQEAQTTDHGTGNRVLINAPGPLHLAASQAGDAVGKKLGDEAVKRINPATLARVRATARSILDAVHSKREAQPDVPIVQRYLDAKNPHRRQDAELDALQRQQAEARRQLNTTDLGEVDEQGRSPTMVREFSNDQEKEAYLQRIRQAQANAAKK